jgi:hypothetical protein
MKIDLVSFKGADRFSDKDTDTVVEVNPEQVLYIVSTTPTQTMIMFAGTELVVNEPREQVRKKLMPPIIARR